MSAPSETSGDDSTNPRDPGSRDPGRQVLDRYPFSARAGVERFRQVWRVALHPKFRPEVRLLRNFIPADRGCLDIGANHGRFAVELARVGCRVLAFEPLGFNLPVVRLGTALARRIRVVPVALGERAGQANIYVPIRPDNRPRHGSAFVAGSDDAARAQAAGARVVRQTIAIERLDDTDLSWLGPGGVGFIKIDVEGHEPSVLRGGKKVLGEHRPSIFMEVGHGQSGLESLGELVDLGYTLYDLDLCAQGRWTTDAEGVHSEICKADKSHDVLAWHEGRGGPPGFEGGFGGTRFGR